MTSLALQSSVKMSVTRLFGAKLAPLKRHVSNCRRTLKTAVASAASPDVISAPTGSVVVAGEKPTLVAAFADEKEAKASAAPVDAMPAPSDPVVVVAGEKATLVAALADDAVVNASATPADAVAARAGPVLVVAGEKATLAAALADDAVVNASATPAEAIPA